MQTVTKKTLYPKTKRVSSKEKSYLITEKLDGSNLGIFKWGDALVVAQRNNVIVYTKEFEQKGLLYKGLQPWLEEHFDHLIEDLHDGSGFFGEWIGMGVIKYGDKLDGIKFYPFAKANISYDETAGFEIRNLIYDRSLFVYPFKSMVVPEYMRIVPLVDKSSAYPDVAYLDALYDRYVKEVGRDVEGFVVNINDNITKYVRMKGGKLTDHQVKE